MTQRASNTVRDSRPVSIRHRGFDAALAHGWVRFNNGWLLTTCGVSLALDEYELLPERSPVTCITCLVKASTR